MIKTVRSRKKHVSWRMDADNLDFLESRLAIEGVNSLPALVNILIARYRNQCNKKES